MTAYTVDVKQQEYYTLWATLVEFKVVVFIEKNATIVLQILKFGPFTCMYVAAV